MIKRDKLIILMTVLPWLTLPFLKRNTIKRFLPASICMFFYLFGESLLAERKKWWRFHYNIKPNALGAIPLLIGPFFVGSLWIMKYTYGNFIRYFITNAIIDSIFTYLLLDWFKKIGYMSLVKLSKLNMSVTFLIEATLLYGFQLLYEKINKRQLKNYNT
ncbi:hypothetical protein [Metabacillus malikii]|uniref:Uncharacterized protein n=1 Tax=Metabacillus malikii TaxID=1504265 RepID=A0ABT9ZF33_9BACI|nr:hypothetical protein [Metabacillus malikii]MDQ0230178.1 hypothetical protein [Metabacillus malikii]